MEEIPLITSSGKQVVEPMIMGHFAFVNYVNKRICQICHLGYCLKMVLFQSKL